MRLWTGAQLTSRQAMKRAKPVRSGVRTEGRADPARHLAGGFVREGHGQDAMGRNAVDRDPVCDGRGEGRRFACASPRQHEDGSGVRSPWVKPNCLHAPASAWRIAAVSCKDDALYDGGNA
jgi:hypothetical protein